MLRCGKHRLSDVLLRMPNSKWAHVCLKTVPFLSVNIWCIFYDVWTKLNTAASISRRAPRTCTPSSPWSWRTFTTRAQSRRPRQCFRKRCVWFLCQEVDTLELADAYRHQGNCWERRASARSRERRRFVYLTCCLSVCRESSSGQQRNSSTCTDNEITERSERGKTNQFI